MHPLMPTSHDSLAALNNLTLAAPYSSRQHNSALDDIQLPAVQVVEYLQPTSAGDPASAGPLYVLEAGSDDYFNYLNQQLPTLNLQISPDIVQESLTNISLVIDTLASNGATK